MKPARVSYGRSRSGDGSGLIPSQDEGEEPELVFTFGTFAPEGYAEVPSAHGRPPAAAPKNPLPASENRYIHLEDEMQEAYTDDGRIPFAPVVNKDHAPRRPPQPIDLCESEDEDTMEVAIADRASEEAAPSAPRKRLRQQDRDLAPTAPKRKAATKKRHKGIGERKRGSGVGGRDAADVEEMTDEEKRDMEDSTRSSLPSEVNPNYLPDAEEQQQITKMACAEFVDLTAEAVVEQLAAEQLDRKVAEDVRRELRSILTCDVDSQQAQQALVAVNERNAQVHKDCGPVRLHAQVQQHGGNTSSRLHVSGSFPVKTVLEEAVQGSGETLACPTNATVMAMTTLLGVAPRKVGMVSNLMPTTVVGPYTAVPKPADFKLFEAAYVTLTDDLLTAGVRVITTIAPSTAELIEQRLGGGGCGRTIVLRERHGFVLKLIIPPDDRPSFLLASPPEHLSHMMWQALKFETRMVLAAGAATIMAPVRALLDLDPLDAQQLINLAGLKGRVGEGKLKGWYTSGAYSEAVMTLVRPLQFIAAYGEERGMELWRAWYKDCKKRGGKKGGPIGGAASLGTDKGAGGSRKGSGYVEAEYTDKVTGNLIGVYALATNDGKVNSPTAFIDRSEVPLTEEEIVERLNEKGRGYYRWTYKIASLRAVDGKILRRLTVEEEKKLRSMEAKERNKLQGWQKPVAGKFRMIE